MWPTISLLRRETSPGLHAAMMECLKENRLVQSACVGKKGIGGWMLEDRLDSDNRDARQ